MPHHRPNMQNINSESQRVGTMAPPSSGRELAWYNPMPDHRNPAILQQVRMSGELSHQNVFFVLPPWSAAGLIAKTVGTHYKLFPNNGSDKCFTLTWPHLGKPCFVCEALKEIHAKWPNLDLSGMMPDPVYYCNILDVNMPEKGVQIIRLSPKVYNWITMQLADPLIQDFTDPVNAAPVKLVKNLKLDKNGEVRVSYDVGLIPSRGPILKDVSQIDKLLEGLWDLDKIFKEPGDKEQLESYKKARELVAYFESQMTIGQRPAMPQGYPVAAPPQIQQAFVLPPQMPSPAPQMAAPQMAAPQMASPVIPAQPQMPAPQMQAMPQSQAVQSPSTKPECFAGAVKHPDGKMGYDPRNQKCLVCPHEFACMDESQKKGIKN